ncbi:MAG: aminotransferase class V-fold PLP-dependent enzyme [Peptococcaceae bacterium]|jgi:cysteine desulfurase family protein|nr:aminotransferase class V-fold PLP-dependent enzyme [Peptococcaceae bacterium]MDH7524905.1 aminotransferase class V-fold PLP-dependent enzyme [Peptococcaceae bacterium]
MSAPRDFIYLDNAATSFPKAPGVVEKMKNYLENVGCNIKRGSYASAFSAEEIVLETREKLCRLFNFPQPDNVVFTLNVTQALNFLIKGLLKPGDHCIVSSMEHNAVMRPLSQVAEMGVQFTRAACDRLGRLDPENITKAFRDNTKAVIIAHASNVCGTILPLEAVGAACRKNGAFFLVDAAQTAGTIEIDFQKSGLDALAFTGHKGLLGPQGTGGFIISDRLVPVLDTLISGGTGSLSDREEVPPFMPDKYEAGTPNIPGLFGLHAALSYLEKEGLESIRQTEFELTAQFLKEAGNLPKARCVGLEDPEGRTAVVSLDFPGKDNSEVAYELSKTYGIMTRSGMHCAPSAHKTLGTYPGGTVRFSFSHFNTRKEIALAIEALHKITKTG